MLGTDGLGRDLLVRIVYGTRVSLLVGLLASGTAVLVGTVVGIAAGWYGGVVDRVLSRAMDVFLALPFLVFALALVAVVGSSLAISVTVIAMFSWASVGRIVRAETLSIREHAYVQAARLLGASHARIMFVEILPNVAATVIVYTTLLIPGAIVAEATLSFLGLSVVPPAPSWGNILSDAMAYYRVAWWFIFFPGAALAREHLGIQHPRRQRARRARSEAGPWSRARSHDSLRGAPYRLESAGRLVRGDERVRDLFRGAARRRSPRRGEPSERADARARAQASRSRSAGARPIYAIPHAAGARRPGTVVSNAGSGDRRLLRATCR